jgi:hypothetical protein
VSSLNNNSNNNNKNNNKKIRFRPLPEMFLKVRSDHWHRNRNTQLGLDPDSQLLRPSKKSFMMTLKTETATKTEVLNWSKKSREPKELKLQRPSLPSRTFRSSRETRTEAPKKSGRDHP